MLQVLHPTERVLFAVREAMDTLGVDDPALFLTVMRRFRGELDAAYHSAGASYGQHNGWGILQWTEEQVAELQHEGLLPCVDSTPQATPTRGAHDVSAPYYDAERHGLTG